MYSNNNDNVWCILIVTLTQMIMITINDADDDDDDYMNSDMDRMSAICLQLEIPLRGLLLFK